MDVYSNGRQLSQCARRRTAHTYTSPSTSLLLNSSEMHAVQKAVWKNNIWMWATRKRRRSKTETVDPVWLKMALSWHMAAHQRLSQQVQCQPFVICRFLEGLRSERLVQNSACKSLPQLWKKVSNFSPPKKAHAYQTGETSADAPNSGKPPCRSFRSLSGALNPHE